VAASRRTQEQYDKLMSVEKDLYTPEEIAALFPEINAEEVRGAVYRGHLKAVVSGDRGEHIVGIHRADFLAWLEHGE